MYTCVVITIFYFTLYNIGSVWSISTVTSDDGYFTDYMNNSSLTEEIFHSYIGGNGERSILISEPWISTDATRSGNGDGGVTKNCMQKLQQFSSATSKFINCSLTNARPMRYCEKCVAEYMSVNNIYGVIFNDESKDGIHGCRQEILRADNIQLVLLTYNFVQTIWKKSTCDNCFNVTTSVNNTKVYHPTVASTELLYKINVTLQCFRDFSNVPKKNVSTNSSVCNNCLVFYQKANDYYEKVEKDGKLCSDLIDSMNYTRLDWGGKYDCTCFVEDRGVLWGISAIVTIFPFALYLFAYFHTKRRAAEVTKEES